MRIRRPNGGVLQDVTAGMIKSVSLAFLLFVLSGPASGQVRPIYDRGTVGLVQLLKRLNTSASVLMIGAHPDDEDTALLAYLARGRNARTAYLSLTRGDGGQNIIGSELGEALGVIRTEELLQARRLDGAEQFFTRAYDYGFSKTLEEAKSKWDERIILCDAVRVIRSFRPLVVVSQFSGTTADGHGQHQFSGYISPLATRAAADASQCMEAGPVWKVSKFYVRHRGPTPPKLRLNTGLYDSLLGRSYFEIAMEARSQHKSQEQGVLELRGDQFSGLNLVGSEIKDNDIFAGLDITAGSQAVNLSERFTSGSSAEPPVAILNELVREYAKTGDLARWNMLRDAVMHAAGIQIDALSDRQTVAAGETVFAAVKVFTRFPELVKVMSVRPVVPTGWTVNTAAEPKTNSPAYLSREIAAYAGFFTIAAPAGWEPTQPYWLTAPRDGDLFRWRRDTVASHTLPIQRPAIRFEIMATVNGIDFVLERPLEYRFADDVRGEIRRNVDVVPRVTVEIDQPLLIIPYSETPQTRSVVLTVTNHSALSVAGAASISTSGTGDLKFDVASRPFELKRTGKKAVVNFTLSIPARTKPGSYKILGGAKIGDSLADLTMRTVAYPHIQTHRIYRRAETPVQVIDLKTTPARVGYIAGSGDRIPEALRQIGVNVTVISETDLATGDLSKFDTIVVGIRAYQVRPDVIASNQRLLDFAKDGGTLVVQYQLPAYAQSGLTPFPTQMGPRVADENAAVTIVAGDHPVLNAPNKIVDSDFVGWVQERNLYNFTRFGADYTGLLESHDPGEAANSGGLVVARVGKGQYIYCSYSLFRQLPAGVPGAYRLLANLVGQPRGR